MLVEPHAVSPYRESYFPRGVPSAVAVFVSKCHGSRDDGRTFVVGVL